MKAGLLEVADLHVVNKADRKDAHRTTVELRAMLRLGGPRQPGSRSSNEKKHPTPQTLRSAGAVKPETP